MPAINLLESSGTTGVHDRATVYAVVAIGDNAPANGTIIQLLGGDTRWRVTYDGFRVIDATLESQAGTYTVNGDDVVPANDYVLISAVFDRTQSVDGDKVKLFFNGVAQGTPSEFNSTIEEQFEDLPVRVDCSPVLGVGNLRMKDLLVFIDVAHDDTTRQAFEAMLADKEGITL